MFLQCSNYTLVVVWSSNCSNATSSTVSVYDALLRLLNCVKKKVQFHLEAFEFMMILCSL